VRYDRIVELPETYRRRRTFAIWRQEADNVGKFLDRSLHDRYFKKYDRSMVAFVKLLDLFKSHASGIRLWVTSSKNPAKLLEQAGALSEWAWGMVANGRVLTLAYSSAHRVAYKRRQLEIIAEEMANTHAGYLIGQAFDFYLDEGILLADVHLGNVGEIRPPDHTSWELGITDPGHMVPLDPKWLQVTIPQLYE
jgi:hypothetical protein